MKEIGKFLKESRKQLDLSISDISNITKMNINIIKNIEAGNIAHFSNDLTYLRYYVKAYANAVNVDFDSLDKELENSTLSYTQSMLVLEQEKIQELNENIRTKKQNISQPLNRGGLQKSRRSIDWTLVSLILIVTLIGAFLLYSVAVNLLDKKPVDDTPPIVNKPDNEKPDDVDEEPIDEKPIIADVKITKDAENPNVYLISNWQKQENFSIKTIFGVPTWVQIQVNGSVVKIPGENNISKTYQRDEELVIKDKYVLGDDEIEFKAEDVIVVRYGIMRGNKFQINNQDYELDESIFNTNSPENITFKLDADVE